MLLSTGAPLNTRLRMAASLLMNWKHISASHLSIAELDKHWRNLRLVLRAGAASSQTLDETSKKALTPDAFASDYRRRELIDKWGPYDAYVVGANFDAFSGPEGSFFGMDASLKVQGQFSCDSGAILGVKR